MTKPRFSCSHAMLSCYKYCVCGLSSIAKLDHCHTHRLCRRSNWTNKQSKTEVCQCSSGLEAWISAAVKHLIVSRNRKPPKCLYYNADNMQPQGKIGLAPHQLVFIWISFLYKFTDTFMLVLLLYLYPFYLPAACNT